MSLVHCETNAKLQAGSYILSLVLMPLWAAEELWDSSCLREPKYSDVSKEALTCPSHELSPQAAVGIAELD